MKFKPFNKKVSVTCERTGVHAGKKFLTITDEANGNVLFQIHATDDDSTIKNWFRLEKETLFGMIGSLWPEEVAIVTDDNE